MSRSCTSPDNHHKLHVLCASDILLSVNLTTLGIRYVMTDDPGGHSMPRRRQAYANYLPRLQRLVWIEAGIKNPLPCSSNRVSTVIGQLSGGLGSGYAPREPADTYGQ